MHRKFGLSHCLGTLVSVAAAFILLHERINISPPAFYVLDVLMASLLTFSAMLSIGLISFVFGRVYEASDAALRDQVSIAERLPILVIGLLTIALSVFMVAYAPRYFGESYTLAALSGLLLSSGGCFLVLAIFRTFPSYKGKVKYQNNSE